MEKALYLKKNNNWKLIFGEKLQKKLIKFLLFCLQPHRKINLTAEEIGVLKNKSDILYETKVIKVD